MSTNVHGNIWSDNNHLAQSYCISFFIKPMEGLISMVSASEEGNLISGMTTFQGKRSVNVSRIFQGHCLALLWNAEIFHVASTLGNCIFFFRKSQHPGRQHIIISLY